MIVTLKSQNPHLLDILNKNPETDFGLFLKPHRNGYIIGNVIGEVEGQRVYRAVFQDTKYSYGQESNQIDFMSMCHPQVLLAILKELFPHMTKDTWDIPWLGKDVSEVDNYPCILTANHIWIDSNWIRDDRFLLTKYIDQLFVTKEGENLYKLTIEASCVKEAVNLASLVGFLITLSNDDYVPLTADLIAKYAKILVSVPVPYFIYYLFIKRLSPQIFAQVKEILERGYNQHHGVEVKFTSGDTHTKRIEFIKRQLDFDKTILDYGCGEFRYTKAYSKLFKSNLYSYDKEDYTELFNTYKERYKFPWSFHTNLDEIPKVDQIILSEVIEHNNPNDVIPLIEDIKKRFNPRKIIITTPNKTFNVHYGIERRHDDHSYEYSREELEILLPGFNIIGVGDMVDNEYVTLAAIYEKE